mgnify:CR=1 FL=1
MNALAIYDELTARRTRFLRVDELCRMTGEAHPKSLPSEQELTAEAALPLRDKKGLEKPQGEFLAQILDDPAAGSHLCHAMLLRRQDSREKFSEFDRRGALELPGVHLERQGKAAVLTLSNPRYLNAEDETTLDGMEIAVDLALLDPKTELCVLRGGPVEHPKYAGRRVFGAGINLTHLYQGKVRLLWYLIRDLGLVNKLYRGLAFKEHSPETAGIEKLWIAAVEGFAMGAFATLHFGMTYCAKGKTPKARSLTLAGVGSGAHPAAYKAFQENSRANAEDIRKHGMAKFAETYGHGAARLQFRDKDPRGFAEYNRQLAEHSTTGSANTMAGYQGRRPSLYGLTDEISRIDVPVLILSGDEDEPCLEASLILKRAISKSGLAILAKSGHGINVEEPGLFNQLLDDFFHRAEAGSWGERDPRAAPPSIWGLGGKP